jgi:hypothetical protein
MPKTYELRDYSIEAGRMDDFVAGWRGGVLPLRERFGFTVEGAWVDVERDRFVWVLGYDGSDGSDGFPEQDAAYYASDERRSLDPDPAQYIRSSDRAVVRKIV